MATKVKKEIILNCLFFKFLSRYFLNGFLKLDSLYEKIYFQVALIFNNEILRESTLSNTLKAFLRPEVDQNMF